jgi:hypothetical protein
LWAVPIIEALKSDKEKRKETAYLTSSKKDPPSLDALSSINSSIQSSTVTTATESSVSSTASWSRSNFEHVLSHFSLKNYQDLQKLAASSYLNGELPTFLMHVSIFLGKWHGRHLSVIDKKDMYKDAARLYFCLIDQHWADIPINLPSTIYRTLETLFEGVKFANASRKPRNVACPWEDVDREFEFSTERKLRYGPDQDHKGERKKNKTGNVERTDSVDTTTSGNSAISKALKEAEMELQGTVKPSVPGYWRIPVAFDVDVFDEAVEHVKADLFNSKVVQK